MGFFYFSQKKSYMKHFLILFLSVQIFMFNLTSCTITETRQLYNEYFTEVKIINKTTDSVQVFLTIQSPNSVIGMFGITDTTGSCSQGYFYAQPNVNYYLNSNLALYGFNISFQSAPVPCSIAISNGFPNGINIFEGSINCEYEVFDISCVDGANCIIKASVSDTINWTTGQGTWQETFFSTQNKVQLEETIGIRGVFPYRCSDCIDINPNNIPPNCFNLPDLCNKERICQVSRTGKKGGEIILEYYGDMDIGTKKSQ